MVPPPVLPAHCPPLSPSDGALAPLPHVLTTLTQRIGVGTGPRILPFPGPDAFRLNSYLFICRPPIDCRQPFPPPSIFHALPYFKHFRDSSPSIAHQLLRARQGPWSFIPGSPSPSTNACPLLSLVSSAPAPIFTMATSGAAFASTREKETSVCSHPVASPHLVKQTASAKPVSGLFLFITVVPKTGSRPTMYPFHYIDRWLRASRPPRPRPVPLFPRQRLKEDFWSLLLPFCLDREPETCFPPFRFCESYFQQWPPRGRPRLRLSWRTPFLLVLTIFTRCSI